MELGQWNTGGTPELLRYIQERSDDIEKVVIPQHPSVFVTTKGDRSSTTEVEAALIIHLVGGGTQIVPHKQDGEAVLNDGILNRMGIKIELGR